MRLTPRPPGWREWHSYLYLQTPLWLNYIFVFKERRDWAQPDGDGTLNYFRTGWFTALMAVCRMSMLAKKRKARMLVLYVIRILNEPMLRKRICEEGDLC